MNKFATMIIELIRQAFYDFDNKLNDCTGILTEDIMASNNPMFQLAEQIAHFITPIALTIITICFLIEFLKMSVKLDILKWEFGLKIFALLAISQAVISAAPFLMSAIYATGADLVTNAMGNVGSNIGHTTGDAIRALANTMKWGEKLGLGIGMLVPMLAIQACTMIIKVMAFARMFEIIVHIAVAPIPCAFLPLEGSQMTKKFFLSFAAVCLQGLFMIICVRLFGVIATTTLQSQGTPNDMMFNLLIGSLVLVMSIVKTGQWSKSILDAN